MLLARISLKIYHIMSIRYAEWALLLGFMAFCDDINWINWKFHNLVLHRLLLGPTF